MGRKRKVWTDDELSKVTGTYKHYLKKVLAGICGKCTKPGHLFPNGVKAVLCTECLAKAREASKRRYSLFKQKKEVSQ
jgi:hypothetical protein